MNADEHSPRATLARIGHGGETLAALTLGRLREAGELVEQGRFSEGYDRLAEAVNKLHVLSVAENSLAQFADSMVVRAIDVQEGAVLAGWGEIVKKTVETEDHGDHTHTIVTIENAEGQVYRNRADGELLIASRSEREIS